MKKKSDILPEHIAIILDGNGRWARQRRLPRVKGHYEGVKRVLEIVEAAHNRGIKVLTLFAFSTENWNRPEKEVSVLMNLLSSFLKQQLKNLLDNNIKFTTIGRTEHVPKSVLNIIKETKEKTKDNTGLVLNLAFNYGSRLEIIDAVKEIAGRVKNGDLDIKKITEQVVTKSLYTRDLPDPDLLIRTSGERRISNFLLWQISYAELYFVDIFWPDFDSKELDKAIADFQGRERRYGNITKN